MARSLLFIFINNNCTIQKIHHKPKKQIDDPKPLLSRSLDDAGLDGNYSYKPLVGCTSIVAPNGKTRRFDYRAGRLVGERNTANQLMASYGYNLYGDGTMTGADRCNKITSTVHDDSGDNTTTVYYDGYGMPVQTIATVAGGGMVNSKVSYDAIDRAVRQYLPVPVTTNEYNQTVSSSAVSYYNDSQPYSSVRYRDMASEDAVDIIREGTLMQGHPERREYLCNSSSGELLKCRKYLLHGYDDDETVELDGLYGDGQLDVTKSVDPDGYMVLTFTNWRGLKLLERRVVDESANRYADTYYLYDAIGRPRVILQSEGVAQMTKTGKSWTRADEVMDHYAFVYRYDRRGNCIYSKTPGAGPVEMLYDRYNRLALRQSAHLRQEGQYECFFYDRIGRLLITGLTTSRPETIPLMTAEFNENSAGDLSDIANLYIFADDAAKLVASDMEIMEQNFYDTYNFINRYDTVYSPFDKSSLNVDNAKGSLTGTIRKILGYNEDDYPQLKKSNTGIDHSRIYTAMAYDIDGNVIKKFSTTAIPESNYMVSSTYSRQGKLVSQEESVGDYSLSTVNNYDTTGALQSANVVAQIFNRSKIFSTQYYYDDLGRLHYDEHGSLGHYKILYGYNLRGQISSIRSNHYSQSLKYEDGANPCFNGNISESESTFYNDPGFTRTYSYDRLNRLVSMSSSEGFNTAYSYNLNSSPLTVERYGLTSDMTLGLVDDLTYRYNGNQLQAIREDAQSVILESSMDYAGSSGENYFYRYDPSGRLIYDSSRQISEIQYHYNGTPFSITSFYNTTSGTKSLEYQYLPDGTKLSVVERNQPPIAEVWPPFISPLGNNLSFNIFQLSRDVYCGSFELYYDIYNSKSSYRKLTTLTRINLPWGYVDSDGIEYLYIRDYQGNICAVVDSNGSAVQTTDYYPYGMSMPLSTGASVNFYKYSGKELETRNGINQYDFHARQYTPSTLLFDQPDVKAADYPWLNPYLYCAANPLRFVDPDGNDIWKINQAGEIIDHIIDEEKDQISFVDENGEILKNSDGKEQTLKFEYGSIELLTGYYENIKTSKGYISGPYDIFKIKGDKDATKFYEMFAKNVTAVTGNEIGLIRTGYLGKGTNYITSAHREATEPGGPHLFFKQLINGYFIREVTHSHKLSKDPSSADMVSKKQIEKEYKNTYKNKIRFKLYISTTDSYIFYTK